MKNSIGIIGGGFVGSAIYKGFSLFCETKLFDINPKLSVNTFAEVLACRFIFVCLPTPQSENGSADLSILYDAFGKINSEITERECKNIIIKSTVPVGTTEYLIKKYNLRILHNPEFLTARTAYVDFITPTRNIIGGYDYNSMQELAQLYTERFPGNQILFMSAAESELVKYTINCFFATKIVFFNEIRMLCDKLNLNWDKIVEGFSTDGRIENSHTDVPGHDGLRGFGGACFPKDINALIHMMIANEIEPMQLKATWEQNKNLRKIQ